VIRSVGSEATVGRNIEIKARATDFADQRARAEKLAGAPPESISQEDTFFRSKRGRLKLRRFDADRGELISRRRWVFQVWFASGGRSIMWRGRGSTWTRSRA